MISTLNTLMDQIRKIRDTFGDDKCYEDWHKLFQLLPEGFTPPKQDELVLLEHCARFVRCRAAGVEYVPPPRWVVGKPDKDGMWILVRTFGPEMYVRVIDNVAYTALQQIPLEPVTNIVQSFGPIPEMS